MSTTTSRIYRQGLGAPIDLPMYLDDPTSYQYTSDRKKCPKALHYYKTMGIKCFGETYRGLMVESYLPEGWYTKSNGTYWVDVVDNNDRTRFSYFTKICWYEQCAFTRKRTRFSLSLNYDIYNLDNEEADKQIQTQILDGDKVIFSTDITIVEERAKGLTDGTEEYRLKRIETINARKAVERRQHKECEAYLKENYPKWKIPTAYWNE